MRVRGLKGLGWTARGPAPAAGTSSATAVAAALIAKAGIYDLQIHHEQILAPVVLRQWDAANVSGLSGEGAKAQEKLMKRLATSEKVARRFAEKRDAAMAPA